MDSSRCPQCREPLPDPAVACASCGYDASKAAAGRSNRLLLVLLFAAMAICVLGVALVWFGSGDSAKTQKVVGLVIFVAGFALYVVTRVIVVRRQRGRL